MHLCKPNNGQPPTDLCVGPPWPNQGRIASPLTDTMLTLGWRVYVPLPDRSRNVRATRWTDDGTNYTEAVTETWTADELATQAQEQAAQAEANRLAWEAEQAAQAAALKALESELDNAERITKALALTILDELNRITTRIRDFDAAVAAASSLADLKTRAAALSAITDRTVEQLKVAVRNRAQELP